MAMNFARKVVALCRPSELDGLADAPPGWLDKDLIDKWCAGDFSFHPPADDSNVEPRSAPEVLMLRGRRVPEVPMLRLAW